MGGRVDLRHLIEYLLTGPLSILLARLRIGDDVLLAEYTDGLLELAMVLDNAPSALAVRSSTQRRTVYLRKVRALEALRQP